MKACGWVGAALAAGLAVLAVLLARAPSYDGSDPLGSGTMFDSIAGQYDIVNRFLSLGMDMSWRRILLQELALRPGDRVLDLATGTADVAILEGQALRELVGEGAPLGKVVGIDPSANMLAKGREKVAAAGLQDLVSLQLGDAQALSDLLDGSFDKISMSFGIRNVPDRERALREARRVSKPGATIAIMDLHAPSTGLLAPIARAAVKLLPTLLGLLARAPEQYRHLERSIFAFPDPQAWQELMAAAGLPVFRAIPLCFGCVWLYLAHPGDTAAAEQPGDGAGAAAEHEGAAAEEEGAGAAAEQEGAAPEQENAAAEQDGAAAAAEQ